MALSWNFYLQHQDLVERAVYYAGVKRYRQDFQDYVEDGMIHLIWFHQHWPKPLETPSQIQYFLKSAFIFVKNRTIDAIRHNTLAKKTQVFDCDKFADPDSLLDQLLEVEVLKKYCTAFELLILADYLCGFSQREIATRWGLSESRISQIFHKIRRHLPPC